MSFIKLHRPDGKEILVNPDHIIMMYEEQSLDPKTLTPAPAAVAYLSGMGYFKFQESLEKVRGQIAWVGTYPEDGV